MNTVEIMLLVSIAVNVWQFFLLRGLEERLSSLRGLITYGASSQKQVMQVKKRKYTKNPNNPYWKTKSI